MRQFKEKGDEKRRKEKKKAPVEPSEIAPVFTVEPETITLKPNTGCEFSFYGNTSLTDTFLEELICEIKQGKEKNGRPMLYVNVMEYLLIRSSSPLLRNCHMYIHGEMVRH